MPKNSQQDQKQARQKKNSKGAQAQGTHFHFTGIKRCIISCHFPEFIRKRLLCIHRRQDTECA